VTLSLETTHPKGGAMSDLTVEAATKQVSAMATQVFEVGLFKPAITSSERHAEMVPRVWESSILLKAIPWLKFQNRDGRNITIYLQAVRSRCSGILSASKEPTTYEVFQR
jgi:hypothetical protein